MSLTREVLLAAQSRRNRAVESELEKASDPIVPVTIYMRRSDLKMIDEETRALSRRYE